MKKIVKSRPNHLEESVMSNCHVINVTSYHHKEIVTSNHYEKMLRLIL